MAKSLSLFDYVRTFFVNAQGKALKRSLRFESSLLSPVAGAITAVPVALVFAIGLAFGNDSGAIAMAVGANLIAIASLVGAPRLSLRVALLDSLLLGLSVYVGVLTGAHSWLHFVVLIPWCFGAGMLEVFGQTSAIVGSQAVIAYVVLGRFTGSASFALHIALLVALGAGVEVLALAALRLPSSLHFQRTRLGLCFDALAVLARQDPRGSATATLTLLDATEAILDAPALFGRSDVRELRATFDQARRLRLEITTIAGLRVRLDTSNEDSVASHVNAAMETLSTVLEGFGNDLRDRSLKSRSNRDMEFETIVSELDLLIIQDADDDVLAAQCVEHLRAVTGQLRAVAKLIETLDAHSGKRVWRPTLPEFVRPDTQRVLADLLTLKDNFTLRSSTFRHAIRLAVAAPTAALIGTALSLPRSFWLTFAVVTILKPDYGSLLDKGIGRMIGTLIGATVASLVVASLHPNVTLTVIFVALAAWVAYATWFASFAVSFGFITALILFLLSITSTDTFSTALDRLIDFSLGGAIAIAAYLVWPTPQESNVRDALSSLYRSLESYFTIVFDVVEGKTIPTDRVVARSRALRVSWSQAESALGRAVNEPVRTKDSPDNARSQLATTMRVLRALHAMRIEAERGATVTPSPELNAFIEGCTVTLEFIREHLEHSTEQTPVNLRGLLRRVNAVLDANDGPMSLSVHLDELVNALDTAAGLVRAS